MSSKGSMSLPVAFAFGIVAALVLIIMVSISINKNSIGMTGDGYVESNDGTDLFYVTVHVTEDESRVYRVDVKDEGLAAEMSAMTNEKCYVNDDEGYMYYDIGILGFRVFKCQKVE